MTLHIDKGSTGYFEAWENLCLSTGRFLASHFNDAINSVYNITPIYIYILDAESTLLAGCKIHVSQSRRLPSFIKNISHQATLFGEYIINPSLTEPQKREAAHMINEGITAIIAMEKINALIVYGHYGSELYLYPALYLNNVKPFNIGLLDLTPDTDTLWNNLHGKHRNAIRKAEKDGVVVTDHGHYDTFKQLLKDTYSRQKGINGPSEIFLDNFYRVTSEAGQCRIYSATINGALTGSALIHTYGTYADYAFAGSNNIHNGANTLMQWRIMQDLKAQGYTTYNMGEIADDKTDYENDKYREGISRFKIRFGCTLQPTYEGVYIASTLKYKLWQTLIKLKQNIL